MSANAVIVSEHYAASLHGDLNGMLAKFDENIRWTEAAGSPYGGTYFGPQAVAEQVFGRIQQDWDHFEVTLDDILDAGDTIIGLGTYSGTSVRSGRYFRAKFAHIWRVRSGKITAFEQITDTALINRAHHA